MVGLVSFPPNPTTALNPHMPTHLVPAHRPSMPRQREFRVFVVEGQTAERTIIAQIVRRDAAFIPDGEAATTHDALQMLDAQTAAPDIIVLSWLLDGGEADRWAFVTSCAGAARTRAW